MKKKKILILGGFGFLGTNLVEELIHRGNFEIIIFESQDILPQNTEILNNVKVYYGDFYNENDYEIIFKENQIDLVIHFISTTIALSSNENINYDIDSNLKSTIHLLNLMKQYEIRNIIFASSGGTVYGIEKNIHKETDPTLPISSYGIIKLAIEKYLYLFNYHFGLNYLILRFSNPYGEYHTSIKQGLINVILKRILKKETIEIWGDGTVVRDYIYIKDLVSVIVDLIDLNIQNEIINVGSGQSYSINEVLDIIKEIIGEFPIKYLTARRVDAPSLHLNIDKLKSYLSLNLIELKEGIRKTLSWLKKHV